MDDVTMLRSFSGAWTGRGQVLPKISDKRPFNVKCDFELSNEGTSITIAGTCGALFVKRPVEVVLAFEDGRATGTYDAQLRTGIATLEGKRDGAVIDLEIRWNGEVNGDEIASMRIETLGPDELRMLITDLDPETGQAVETSDITLKQG